MEKKQDNKLIKGDGVVFEARTIPRSKNNNLPENSTFSAPNDFFHNEERFKGNVLDDSMSAGGDIDNNTYRNESLMQNEVDSGEALEDELLDKVTAKEAFESLLNEKGMPQSFFPKGKDFEALLNNSDNIFYTKAMPLLVFLFESPKVQMEEEETFRKEIESYLQGFNKDLGNENVPSKFIYRASYALCCFVDEYILGKSWSIRSSWAQETILASFHRESYGGERFFELFINMRHDGAPEARLLGAMMLLLVTLGYRGKYAVIKDGKNQLFELVQDQRNELFHKPTFATLQPSNRKNIVDVSKPISLIFFGLVAVVVALVSLFVFWVGSYDAVSYDIQMTGERFENLRQSLFFPFT